MLQILLLFGSVFIFKTKQNMQMFVKFIFDLLPIIERRRRRKMNKKERKKELLLLIT